MKYVMYKCGSCSSLYNTREDAENCCKPSVIEKTMLPCPICGRYAEFGETPCCHPDNWSDIPERFNAAAAKFDWPKWVKESS
jgi:hypothetical protein